MNHGQLRVNHLWCLRGCVTKQGIYAEICSFFQEGASAKLSGHLNSEPEKTKTT